MQAKRVIAIVLVAVLLGATIFAAVIGSGWLSW